MIYLPQYSIYVAPSVCKLMTFTEPMECLAVAKLPESTEWIYEVKLDGYRAQAIRDGQGMRLLSRNGKSLSDRAPHVLAALESLRAGTAVDGELVALDEQGRPSFNLLQNYRSASANLVFYAFDLLSLRGKDLKMLPLAERRKLLQKTVSTSDPSLQLSEPFALPAERMLTLIREHGLEGVIAKRLSSVYEAGRRSGAWVKLRINLGQEFVVGGYVPGSNGFDSIVIGVYRRDQLFYVARVRAGFVPASRRDLFKHLEPLRTTECPFVNLPQSSAGRWGQGLTAEKMRECIWLRPETVVACEFLEWTPGGQVRHIKFTGLREDKDPRSVVQETLSGARLA